MPAPNFKINENIENNVSRLLENQPLPETKTSPLIKPERPVEIQEAQKGMLETTAPPEKMEIKKEPSFAKAMAGKKEGLLDNTIDALKQKLKRQKIKTKQIPQVRDKITIQVEKIMEAGLQDAYKEMSLVQQQEFKIKGEKTAMEIRDLFRAGKIKIKKIIKLLISWLRLLPGVNKFFLEQEAKIKADKIIALKNFDKQ